MRCITWPHGTTVCGDFNCWVRTIATAQLVGAPLSDELKTADQFGKAIEDRLKNKLPDGCEEWTFTMTRIAKMANNRSDWTIRWAAGKFRVNRELGIVDGAFRAGYVPESGWPGIIGGATDDCISESEEGTINYGPGTISPAAFRYKIDGTVSESEIDLSVSSEDAKVSMSAPSEPLCQFAAATSSSFAETLFREGWPVTFSVSADEEVATFEFSDEDGSMTAEIKRTPVVKP